MPVFLFAVAVSNPVEGQKVLLVFIILHVFLYPASNAYNSFFDRDEQSIGGLKNPPPVDRQLYATALVFDAIAILLGLLISWQFAVMLLVYGLASKAYSHPAVRLKKYAFTSWIVAGFFQGFFTLWMSYVALTETGVFNLPEKVWYAAGLSSAILLGSYPMTQIYQHEEDSRRGDRTLSILLGVRGTFLFTLVVFLSAIAGFVMFFLTFYDLRAVIAFFLFTAPMVLYFLWWFARCLQNRDMADFKHTMRLNLLSSLALGGFFVWLWSY